MDWKRNGGNQSSSDPEIQSAFRQGISDYWSALRRHMPNQKIIANADNDLGYSEFKGKTEGAFLECLMGKSWSREKSHGWHRMMTEYRNALANTLPPHDVVLNVCSSERPDLKLMRYGLASALLEDGWFAYTVAGMKPPFYADEYSVSLGAAVEPPPKVANGSGIWMRRYANGLVLVNPGTTEAAVQVGPGYTRLSGAQDRATNDGQPVTRVNLPPREGLILLKR